jgi:hypothetical protein
MTSHSKFTYRYVPQENLKYLPNNAVAIGGVRGRKGIVRVRFDLDWVKRSNKKLEVLFRGIDSPMN